MKNGFCLLVISAFVIFWVLRRTAAIESSAHLFFPFKSGDKLRQNSRIMKKIFVPVFSVSLLLFEFVTFAFFILFYFIFFLFALFLSTYLPLFFSFPLIRKVHFSDIRITNEVVDVEAALKHSEWASRTRQSL